jgi:phosphonate transport system permease protein
MTDPAARLEAARRAHARTLLRGNLVLGGLFLLSFAAALPVGGFSLARLVEGWPEILSYIGAILPALRADHLREDIAEWYWGFWRYLRLMADTVLIAYAGTLLGVGGALLLVFPASATLGRSAPLRFACRRLLEAARSVPELVFALIFVVAFGVGPVAGVLALAVHSAGALGKLFAEANDNLDPRPLDGVAATGASRFGVIRLSVLPQVLPNYASYTLFRFEINIRSASVLGFVGAGGIGQELYTSIRSFAYTDVSAVLLVIVAAVVLVDLASQAVRRRFLDAEVLR